MPKVLALVSFAIFPPRMGGQKGVALFYQYLSYRCEIHMAATFSDAPSGGLPYVATRTLHSNKRMPLNVFQLNKLVALIREENIDCIIAEHSYTGWIGYMLSKKCKIPFIIHSHNIESTRFRLMGRWWWNLYAKFERWVHQKADHSFFISDEDKNIAAKSFYLDKSKCTVIPYGVGSVASYSLRDREAFRDQLGISEQTLFLYFNGTLDYKPNVDAVWVLLQEIGPRLQRLLSHFKIIITGQRISQKLKQALAQNENFTYAGFVDDIGACYNAADIFLNPVVNNSGVKTKVIEALAHHCTVVSSVSGATGVPADLCRNKLIPVPDNRWDLFANAIERASKQPPSKTPQSFFEYFYWQNIAIKATQKIEETINNG